MAKTFDIRNKTAAPVKTFGKAEDKPEPQRAEKKQVVLKESFITRFLDIMLYDILHKFGRGPYASDDRINKEKYEEFQRLARGDR